MRDEHNPFRTLLETWLVQEMVFHHNECGLVVRELANIGDFWAQESKAAFRSATISGGDFRKFVRSFREDYSERLQRRFWVWLSIMKKTVKEDPRPDWLNDLDIDEVFGVLRRDDDGEIVAFCLDHCLYPGEQNGHPGEVRRIRA